LHKKTHHMMYRPLTLVHPVYNYTATLLPNC